MAEFEALCDEADMVNDEVVELVSTAISQMRKEVDKRKRQKLEESVDMSFPDDANESNSIVPETLNEFSTAEVHIGATNSCPGSCDVVVKDPLLQKKRRGRPKGSRNKTLAEMGFKKPVPKSKKMSTNDINKNDTSSNNKTKNTSKHGTSKGLENNEDRGNLNKAKDTPNIDNDQPRRSSNTKDCAKTNKSDTRTSKRLTPLQALKAPRLKSLNDLVPLVCGKGKKQSTKHEAKRKASTVNPTTKASKVHRAVIE